jgi:hypothetical protein
MNNTETAFDQLEDSKAVGYELNIVKCLNCNVLIEDSNGYCDTCELLIEEASL